MERPLTGGCNCGAVRYEVTESLVRASYCHCRRCQRRTGTAASASAQPAPGAFRIVAGEEQLRMWQPHDGGEKWFCGVCGSSIFGRNPTRIRGHPDGDVRRGPGRSPDRAAVRRLCDGMGAAAGRRTVEVPREPPCSGGPSDLITGAALRHPRKGARRRCCISPRKGVRMGCSSVGGRGEWCVCDATPAASGSERRHGGDPASSLALPCCASERRPRRSCRRPRARPRRPRRPA